MKSLIITLFICFGATLSSFAQCGANYIIATSITNLADPSGNPTGSKDEKTTLRFSRTGILLNIDGHNVGELKIVSHDCNWTTPYKNGKSVIKALLNDYDYTLTIEGKDRKISLRVVKENSDDSILTMTADKFEKVE